MLPPFVLKLFTLPMGSSNYNPDLYTQYVFVSCLLDNMTFEASKIIIKDSNGEI